jgi:transposase-like protein
MGSLYRNFIPEFKVESVELLIRSDGSVAEIARDFGIGDGTLENWLKAAKKYGRVKKSSLEIGEGA